MSESKKKNYETWFRMANSTTTDELSTEDLQRVLCNRITENGSKSYFSLETVKLLIRIVSKGKKSTVNLKEFEQLWEFLSLWRKLFKEYDKDDNGTLEKPEFESAVNKLGFKLQQNIIDIIFDRFDISGSGRMEFDDFIRVCLILRDLGKKFKSKSTDEEPDFALLSYNDFIEFVFTSAVF